jgi:signal transduction histidine kinase
MVAAQTATAVAVVVLAMAGAVLLVDEHQQHQQAEWLSRSAWASADDVVDPPAGIWLVVVDRAGHRQISPGAPPGIGTLDPRSLASGATSLTREGHEFQVWTDQRPIGRVSAAYDLSPHQLEERILLVSLGIAALVGVAGAAAVGALIGRRAVRPLGQAMALQRRFVTDASHELRTPLTVLAMRAQLLRRHLRGTVGPERTAELDRLVHDAKVLGEVVNDLLLSADLAHRPQVGQPVDVGALAADAVESMQPLAAERSVELAASRPAGSDIRSDTELDARSDTGPDTVNGAPAALRRAIVSLVDNAIAHTSAGGHVQVDVGGTDRQVLISVIDDGEGLDSRLAHRLVERFARGGSSQAGRRFGLGLALVDEIARAHGGSLVVGGELGRGATFTLRLPRAL